MYYLTFDLLIDKDNQLFLSLTTMTISLIKQPLTIGKDVESVDNIIKMALNYHSEENMPEIKGLILEFAEVGDVAIGEV